MSGIGNHSEGVRLATTGKAELVGLGLESIDRSTHTDASEVEVSLALRGQVGSVSCDVLSVLIHDAFR